MLNYGVLRGRVVDFGREDDSSSPHFQVVVQAPFQGNPNRWRVPVNVKSSSGSGVNSQVLFSVADPLVNHALIAQLMQIPEGFTPEGGNSWFLDYLREPMFDITAMRAIPHAVPGPDNDLQDNVAHRVELAKRDNLAIFAFGSQFPAGDPRPADVKFNTHGGVHDIHMNQGNPVPGPFAGDNGIHQDGGLIIQTGTNSFTGIFLAFQTQFIPTDTHGAPLPGAKPILAAHGPNTAPQAADLSIVGACVNPLGADVGLETVILLNTTSAPMNLAGFVIEDKQGKREPLSGTLAGGDARRIVLSGTQAQLSNSGGVIRIIHLADGGVMHAVTYTAQGSAEQGRTLVF